MRTKTKAQRIARIADEKKAENIVVLDVRKVCNYTDYFVMATGQTTNHLKAVCDELFKALSASGELPIGFDGINAPSWRVLDYGDVIFHCFTEDVRCYYKLERLWADGALVEWQRKRHVKD